MTPRRWFPFIALQDFVWLMLFFALGALSPTRTQAEISLLACLALLQVAKPKIPILLTPRGNIASIFLKLVLAYLLIGYTGAVNSSYYLILLLPVASAATSLRAAGTITFTLLACASYVSFLLYVDWSEWVLLPDQLRELNLRVTFLCVVGFLAYCLAESTRVEARKYEAAAEELASARRSLKEAEAAVLRSERLAALGQLTAGLAHELRNPLGTIRVSAEMLRKNITEDNTVAAELAGFIATEVDRTNSLVTRFLDFARPLQLRLQQTDIVEVIDRAVDQLKNHPSGSRVSVFKNYSPDVPPFLLDAELMERVIFNLLVNAAEASPPAGTVTVKTRGVDGSVEVSVIDRGAGIDPGHRENIFNPFFTTKAQGVGLGLSIVSKIVDEHGGKMTVESEVDKGSVFRIYLPTTQPARNE